MDHAELPEPPFSRLVEILRAEPKPDRGLKTYKSIRESLTTGSMLELLSHAVAYAKQHWRDEWEAKLLQHDRMRAIAVSTHHPAWLKPEQAAGQTMLVPGVYEATFLQMAVRVIVPREVALSPRNALWHLLSGDPEIVAYGLQHCDVQDSMLYNVLNDLRETYSLEGMEMPYTIEDYRREVMRENWADLSPEERLKGLSQEQIEAYLEALREKAGSNHGETPD